MASTRQLIQMIRSHAAGDDLRFLSVAESIAEEAGKAGRARMAKDLLMVIEAARATSSADASPATPIASPRGELASLLKASYPDTHLSDLVLSPDLNRRLNRAVREHRERSVLAEKNLAPRRKFLFSGPPGTGKGMSAAAIAGELGMPLFTILLDGVINKFMGETASKLRLVFDAMASVRGVYFFDEVDALASRRNTDNDVGEARRMLNSFLQFLEDDKSNSVIIAATNHRSLLDSALFRRFDGAFIYQKPNKEEAKRVIVNGLLGFDLASVDFAKVEAALGDLSQADLVAAAGDAARDAVLDNNANLSTDLLIQALIDRRAVHPD